MEDEIQVRQPGRAVTRTSVEICIRGTVQGVGFRPAAWRIATALGLAGEVLNDAEGVLIRLEGIESAIADFLRRIIAETPPLARIDAIETTAREHAGYSAFRIVGSRGGNVATSIAPDERPAGSVWQKLTIRQHAGGGIRSPTARIAARA